MNKSEMIHMSSSGSAFRVGEEEMNMLARMKEHSGDASIASILRRAVRDLYMRESKNMPPELKRMTYVKKVRP